MGKHREPRRMATRTRAAVVAAGASGALLAGALHLAAPAAADCERPEAGPTQTTCGHGSVPTSNHGKAAKQDAAELTARETELEGLTTAASQLSDQEFAARSRYEVARSSLASRRAMGQSVSDEDQRAVDALEADVKAKELVTRKQFEDVVEAAGKYMAAWNADPERKATAEAARGEQPSSDEAAD